MSTRCVLLCVCVVAFAMAGAVESAWAQGVGAIGGTVRDVSGAVLPGATVTLASAQGGTLGGSQETVSDGRGNYQFLRLPPGTYSVRGQMQGFRPLEQRNIVVSADATARADLTLQLGQLEEGVVVSGEAPLLDTTSALRQTVLSQETLQSLPNRMDLWAITRVIPSVVTSKVDVGGSESFQQSGITVHGTQDENGYYIDGMNVSSTQSNGGIATFYLDPYAFAEGNFQQGNAPAESSTGGLVFNMISRTGTNQFHGGANFAGTNSGLTSNNVSDAVAADIFARVPASVKAARPDLKPSNDLRYFYDWGAWLAGPVKSDKLWFSASFHHQQVLQYLVGSYNPDGNSVPDDNLMWNFSGKLAWQMSQPSQLSWFYIVQRKINGHRASTTNFVETGATTHNPKTPQLHQVKYTRAFGSKMVLDASGSLNRVDDYQPWPKEGDTSNCKSAETRIGCTNGLIAGFDQVTNTALRILPTYRDLPNTRVFLRGSASVFTGAHDIKAGYVFDYAYDEILYFSSSGMRANYRAGVPDSVNTYNTPARSIPENIQQGYYVQDKWVPVPKLTLNLGLRLDTNYGWSRALCQDATPFIEAKCYDEIKGVPDFTALNPRFSMIYDLAGDGRTALKFAANRYIVPLGSTVSDRVNPISLANDTRAWTACAPGQTSACDLNGDRLPQVNELGPSNGYNFGTVSRYADGYGWPYALEYSAELQRQLPGNMVATVGFTRREKKGNFGNRNEAVPTSTYTPLEVTETNSGRTVTVYNQAPALRGEQDVVWDNRPELDTVYHGTDITLNKRMSDGWMMTGGVSFGKNTGYIYSANTDLNNPNFFYFADGIEGRDMPYALRLSGVYALPWDISMSGTLMQQEGFPELTTVSVGNNTVRLTQGTTSITVEPRATSRLPKMNQLDMSFRKAIRSGGKVFQPRIDLFNMLNASTVLSRTTVLGPNLGSINSIQRGRMIKVAMSYDF